MIKEDSPENMFENKAEKNDYLVNRNQNINDQDRQSIGLAYHII
ncbi:hypothetical protein [Lactococcus fujiensis]|uniref:Uncharacterized protein n=1 Tax=Lactococcus fujiensis JCM 16395 TaxID=1291764 RepID=A0A2A5RLT1_9LACT|nr:hypothetical protein [Lactococcus fujiensis]PCS00230.1 hypothetical protein RT41_GL001541 [Lactococcus fujiensis JCM 16395]